MSIVAIRIVMLISLVQLSTSFMIEEGYLGGNVKVTKIMKRSDHYSRNKKLITIEIFTIIDYSIFKKFYEESKATTDAERKENAKKNILFIFTHIMEGSLHPCPLVELLLVASKKCSGIKLSLPVKSLNVSMRSPLHLLISKFVKQVYERIESKKYKFTTKLAGALIAENSNDLSFIENSKISDNTLSGSRILANIGMWVLENKGNLPKHDFVAAFTRYNIKEGKTTIKGRAGWGSICTIASTGIIGYEDPLQTIHLLSHELGHALGAFHDGDIKSCRHRSDFIMEPSYKRSLLNNSFAFSKCSVGEIEDRVYDLEVRRFENCLEDDGKEFNEGRERDVFLQIYPGQIYNLDDQCAMIYEPETFYAGGNNSGRSLCRNFKCSRGRFGIEAMEGTTCSDGAWCIKGECTPNSNAPRAPERCINGDYKLPFPLDESSNFKCKDLINENRDMCNLEKIKSYCCSSCAYNQTWNGGCQDTTNECQSLESRDCYNEYYAAACCDTCRALVRNPSDANCLYGDKGVNCSNLVPEVCQLSTRYCCQTCADYLSYLSSITAYNRSASPAISNAFSTTFPAASSASNTSSFPSSSQTASLRFLTDLTAASSTVSENKTTSSTSVPPRISNSSVTIILSMMNVNTTTSISPVSATSDSENLTETKFTVTVPPKSTSASSNRTRVRCSKKKPRNQVAS